MPRRKRYLRPQQGGVGSGASAGQGGLLEGILAAYTGGILGAQDSSNDFGQNQAVTEPYASPGGGAEFYSPKGEVTNQPFADTRNWWERNITRVPNQAENYNKALQFQGAVQQNAIPGQLRLAQGQADINRKSALEQFEAENAYNAGQVADVNPLYNNPSLASAQEPGQVPFEYSIDPQRAITDRNMPFVGDTSGGKSNNAQFVMGNVKAGQEAQVTKAREIAAANRAFLGSTGQAPVGENLAPSPEQLQIGADIRGAELERTRATTQNLTKPAFHYERGQAGEPSWIFPEEGGKIGEPSMFGTEPAYKGSKPNPNAGRPYFRKPVSNLPYNPNGGSSTNNLKVEASKQGAEYPIAPGVNGGPPTTITSVGGAPTGPTSSIPFTQNYNAAPSNNAPAFSPQARSSEMVGPMPEKTFNPEEALAFLRQYEPTEVAPGFYGSGGGEVDPGVLESVRNAVRQNPNKYKPETKMSRYGGKKTGEISSRDKIEEELKRYRKELEEKYQ